jgi:hypothetical protein
MRSGMDVGAAGGTTIERNEPPRRLPPELLPTPPAVPAARGLGLGLVIGVVALIAICVLFAEWFTTQLDPAGDRAMADARHAAVAIEAFASGHGGSYAGATVDDLDLPGPSARGRVELYTAPGSYVIAVQDGAGATFSLRRDYEGTEWLTCSPAGEGACPATGEWR